MSDRYQCLIRKQALYGDYELGQPTRVKHVQIGDITTTHVLELLHVDLFGLAHVESVGGKKYALVSVDDYSRNTWIDFLKVSQTLLHPSKKYV